MRIWDIDPGYLNRQSLLGEHRELHALVSVISNRKKGYSRHPETMRWADFGWAIRQRHRILAAEMSLRGYADKTPVLLRRNEGRWPANYVDEPRRQFSILERKYRQKEKGRIALPSNAQQLWSQHKYSILARDVELYRRIGRTVAEMKPNEEFSDLARLLAESLRIPPSEGGMRNCLQHLWGHVSDSSDMARSEVETCSPIRLLTEIRKCAIATAEPYVMNSTAIGELSAWMS